MCKMSDGSVVINLLLSSVVIVIKFTWSGVVVSMDCIDAPVIVDVINLSVSGIFFGMDCIVAASIVVF